MERSEINDDTIRSTDFSSSSLIHVSHESEIEYDLPHFCLWIHFFSKTSLRWYNSFPFYELLLSFHPILFFFFHTLHLELSFVFRKKDQRGNGMEFLIKILLPQKSLSSKRIFFFHFSTEWIVGKLFKLFASLFTLLWEFAKWKRKLFFVPRSTLDEKWK